MIDKKIKIKVIAFLAIPAMVFSFGFSSSGVFDAGLTHRAKPYYTSSIPVIAPLNNTIIKVIDSPGDLSVRNVLGLPQTCGFQENLKTSIQGFGGLMLNQSGNCYTLSGVSEAKNYAEIKALNIQSLGASIVVPAFSVKIADFQLMPFSAASSPKAAFIFGSLLALFSAASVLKKIKPRVFEKGLAYSYSGGALLPEQLMVFRC